MELVPSRSERKSWSVKIAHTLFSPRRHASWLKKRRRSAATHFYENIFFWDIFTGPIPFFLTFHSELKKVSNFWNRPRIADSRGNFSLVQHDAEGPGQQHTQWKSEKFQSANWPQWPIPSSVPHWPWLKKMDFRALARALRAHRLRKADLRSALRFAPQSEKRIMPEHL